MYPLTIPSSLYILYVLDVSIDHSSIFVYSLCIKCIHWPFLQAWNLWTIVPGLGTRSIFPLISRSFLYSAPNPPVDLSANPQSLGKYRKRFLCRYRKRSIRPQVGIINQISFGEKPTLHQPESLGCSRSKPNQTFSARWKILTLDQRMGEKGLYPCIID